MTDGTATQAPAPDEQPDRPSRWVLVLGGAAAVVILATIGAVGGWMLAEGGDGVDGVREPQAGPSVESTTPEQSTTPGQSTSTPRADRPTTGRSTAGPTVTTAPADGLALPDLTGWDFEQARAKLRGLGLKWQLIFDADDGEGDDDGRRVARTEPRPDARVRLNDTVHLFVVGAAPPATVPGVTGMSCPEAGQLVADHGLYPRYPQGTSGQVLRQDPESPGELHWNDWVQLFCGT